LVGSVQDFVGGIVEGKNDGTNRYDPFINDDLACPLFPFLTVSPYDQDFTILEFNQIIIFGVHVLPIGILDRFDDIAFKKGTAD
jgi:hypothetical protein